MRSTSLAICLLCLGYPTQAQKDRELTPRYDRQFIVFENQYKRLDRATFEAMYRERHERTFKDRSEIEGAANIGQLTYLRKFSADFSFEMSRSVRAILDAWRDADHT